MDREDLAILAVGDNVVDKYLSRGKMYPGGQCVNTCVYAQENGVRAAYLGVCGEGVEARLIEDTLNAKGIDHSRCRHAPTSLYWDRPPHRWIRRHRPRRQSRQLRRCGRAQSTC